MQTVSILLVLSSNMDNAYSAAHPTINIKHNITKFIGSLLLIHCDSYCAENRSKNGSQHKGSYNTHKPIGKWKYKTP